MFFNGPVFWFLLGIVTIVVGAGFKAFAEDRGWTLTWWKWLLAMAWYGIFMTSFLTLGTLLGEFYESGAAWRLFALGMFISLVLGVGLWRVLSLKPQPAEARVVSE